MDQNSVVRIMWRDRSKLMAYIWTIVHDPHLADDIYQEVSITALEKHDEIQDEQHLGKWLRQVARFKALKALRDKYSDPLTPSGPLLDRLEREWQRYDDTSGSDRMDALRCCLEKLSPYAMRLIHLRYGEGLTGQSLADRVNRKVETIYVALSRIHRALFHCIRKIEEAQAQPAPRP